MNLYLRLFRVLVSMLFVRRSEIFAESRLSFRVWLSDCDLNLHMNNGRYLTFMDLGRLHVLAQTGMFRLVLKHRWAPVLSAAEINYIRGLRPFQSFTLITRLLTWDEKYFYLEQRFEHEERTYAIANVRGLFLAKGHRVPSADVVRALGIGIVPPEMPAAVSHWKELTALKKEQAARLG